MAVACPEGSWTSMANIRRTHRALTAEIQRPGLFVTHAESNQVAEAAMWPNGAGTPSAKLPRLVSSGLVWTPYLIARPVIRVLYIVGVYPPFPALIETGGKTDTQSAAHA